MVERWIESRGMVARRTYVVSTGDRRESGIYSSHQRVWDPVNQSVSAIRWTSAGQANQLRAPSRDSDEKQIAWILIRKKKKKQFQTLTYNLPS